MIQVAIIEDIPEIREGLQLLIDGSDGFSCQLSYGSGEDALKDLPGYCPDVVFVDINLPGINGIETVRQLKSRCPKTLCIMSTVYEDTDSIFESLKAGASGYLLKKTAPQTILESVREVYSGGSPMNSHIARKVIESFQKKDTIDSNEVLTSREKEILRLLAKGLRYKEIAAELFIGLETVRTHARNIYEKLQVQSRMEAINKVMGH